MPACRCSYREMRWAFFDTVKSSRSYHESLSDARLGVIFTKDSASPTCFPPSASYLFPFLSLSDTFTTGSPLNRRASSPPQLHQISDPIYHARSIGLAPVISLHLWQVTSRRMPLHPEHLSLLSLRLKISLQRLPLGVLFPIRFYIFCNVIQLRQRWGGEDEVHGSWATRRPMLWYTSTESSDSRVFLVIR